MEFLAPFAEYYYYVYWFVVMLMTVKQFNIINKYPKCAVIERSFDYQPLLLFSVFFIIFYGLRPVHTGLMGDTVNYANTYELLQNFGVFNMEGGLSNEKPSFGSKHLMKVSVVFSLFFSCSSEISYHLI